MVLFPFFSLSHSLFLSLKHTFFLSVCMRVAISLCLSLRLTHAHTNILGVFRVLVFAFPLFLILCFGAVLGRSVSRSTEGLPSGKKKIAVFFLVLSIFRTEWSECSLLLRRAVYFSVNLDLFSYPLLYSFLLSSSELTATLSSSFFSFSFSSLSSFLSSANLQRQGRSRLRVFHQQTRLPELEGRSHGELRLSLRHGRDDRQREKDVERRRRRGVAEDDADASPVAAVAAGAVQGEKVRSDYELLYIRSLCWLGAPSCRRLAGSHGKGKKKQTKRRKRKERIKKTQSCFFSAFISRYYFDFFSFFGILLLLNTKPLLSPFFFFVAPSRFTTEKFVRMLH